MHIDYRFTICTALTTIWFFVNSELRCSKLLCVLSMYPLSTENHQCFLYFNLHYSANSFFVLYSSCVCSFVHLAVVLLAIRQWILHFMIYGTRWPVCNLHYGGRRIITIYFIITQSKITLVWKLNQKFTYLSTSSKLLLQYLERIRKSYFC